MGAKVKYTAAQKERARKRRWENIKKNRWLYVMFAPVLIYYIIFKYVPMVGIVIAFKKYNAFKGIIASPWVGFANFARFFNSVYAWRLIRNTFLISFYGLIFGFPAPILLALLLNELKDGAFKKITQTISYLPHFLSSVIIAGILISFLRPETGLFNNIRAAFGQERVRNPRRTVLRGDADKIPQQFCQIGTLFDHRPPRRPDNGLFRQSQGVGKSLRVAFAEDIRILRQLRFK